MTISQEHSALAVGLPEQRSADHDAPVPAPPRRQPGAWVTREDQLICRWMMVGMLCLGLYAALFVWLGARVFG